MTKQELIDSIEESISKTKIKMEREIILEEHINAEYFKGKLQAYSEMKLYLSQLEMDNPSESVIEVKSIRYDCLSYQVEEYTKTLNNLIDLITWLRYTLTKTPDVSIIEAKFVKKEDIK